MIEPVFEREVDVLPVAVLIAMDEFSDCPAAVILWMDLIPAGGMGSGPRERIMAYDIEGLARVGRIGAASLGISELSSARARREGGRSAVSSSSARLVPGTSLTPRQYGEAVRLADMRTARIERARAAYRAELERF